MHGSTLTNRQILASWLPREFSAFAFLPAQILALIPAGLVWMAFQRAMLVRAGETTSIMWASIAEVVTVITVLAVTIHALAWVGAVVAATTILLGRVVGNLWLTTPAIAAARDHVASRHHIDASVLSGEQATGTRRHLASRTASSLCTPS